MGALVIMEDGKEKDREFLCQLEKAYFHRWHNLASFCLGSVSGALFMVFIWALWNLIHHG